MSESAVKLVTNAEQHARGGPRVILPKVNWPYYGDVYNPKIHGTYDPSIKAKHLDMEDQGHPQPTEECGQNKPKCNEHNEQMVLQSYQNTLEMY
ncbi:hypothetical protein MAR_028769 [Mya arenaria]|uniref:Uncharacterized protein n=1 Tax=Mya arenaria TaxID=6604 RepID=A0ABY7DHX4_MYAAR|nr:hypothetical protein MAR_028769 [Mya arenaria]